MSSSSDLLQQIQSLQFTDKPAAEHLLRGFIMGQFPQFSIAAVELRPLAISLNSFNGFLTLTDGTRYFFKTHTEPDNVIGEYYRAATLADAGYAVIQPLFSSTEAGKQLLIYALIDSPAVFDVAWDIEQGDTSQFALLTQAQQNGDDELFRRYQATLHTQSAADAAQAPVHQLFHHRLTQGRLRRFYGDLTGDSPTDNSPFIAATCGQYSMAYVSSVKWVINGQVYQETLADIVQRAVVNLAPAQADVAIVGHGDAHNGNVFLMVDSADPTLLYFDPAFAGSHHPLLDLTKPLFHNVFAMWMYFPQVKQASTAITCDIVGDTWHVQYDYTLHPVRQMFLHSKLSRVLIPTLQMLKAQNQLRADWRSYLKSALFCCPFLTMNLADAQRFPPEIALLGLAMSVEMGAESHQLRSVIDQALDEAAASLA